MCLTTRMELINEYLSDLIESSMCLTTRMELTGWYYRDQNVTKPCVLLHVWS